MLSIILSCVFAASRKRAERVGRRMLVVWERNSAAQYKLYTLLCPYCVRGEKLCSWLMALSTERFVALSFQLRHSALHYTVQATHALFCLACLCCVIMSVLSNVWRTLGGQRLEYSAILLLANIVICGPLTAFFSTYFAYKPACRTSHSCTRSSSLFPTHFITSHYWTFTT